jgi:hypothetical protein
MFQLPGKSSLITSVAVCVIACASVGSPTGDAPCSLRIGYVLFSHPSLMVGIDGNADRFRVILVEVVGHTPPDSLGSRLPICGRSDTLLIGRLSPADTVVGGGDRLGQCYERSLCQT